MTELTANEFAVFSLVARGSRKKKNLFANIKFSPTLVGRQSSDAEVSIPTGSAGFSHL